MMARHSPVRRARAVEAIRSWRRCTIDEKSTAVSRYAAGESTMAIA